MPPFRFGELIDLVDSGQVTRPTGKLLLKHMLINDIPSTKSVKEIAEQLDMLLTPSTPAASTSSISPEDDVLHHACLRAIDALPSEIAAIKAGNPNVMNKVIGWVMRETKGKADVKRIRDIINDTIRRA
jgi:aspartyl-tRNA(Asn)/glutamyl-tRNA(Gln) amidotransferase subunit B